MNKMRGLLLFVALLTITGQIIILNTHLHSVWRFVLHVGDGILLISALIMLMFSFFRVGITASGELCYNPDNWYWKTIAWFYDVLDVSTNPFGRGKVSLCTAFWLTVLAISMVVASLGGTVLISNTLWELYLKFGLLKIILVTLGTIAVLALFVGGLYGTITATDKISHKFYQVVTDKPRLRNAVEAIGNVLQILFLIGILFLFLVILPIMAIMDSFKVSLHTAIIYYLIGVAGLSLTIGGVILLIWFLFKYLPRIASNTVLGQFLLAKKKDFCPTLTRCCT